MMEVKVWGFRMGSMLQSMGLHPKRGVKEETLPSLHC